MSNQPFIGQCIYWLSAVVSGMANILDHKVAQNKKTYLLYGGEKSKHSGNQMYSTNMNMKQLKRRKEWRDTMISPETIRISAR
jgi:hypothetical protein